MKFFTSMLNKNKYETPRTFPLSGIAVTRESSTDGLPAQNRVKNEENDEYISFNAYVITRCPSPLIKRE